jgi:hypothetical protein
MPNPAARLALCHDMGEREFSLAIEVLARWAKTALLACATWPLTPPNLPAYPPIDCSQEPGAARAVRQRRIKAAVDDLLAPPGPDDVPYTSARF